MVDDVAVNDGDFFVLHQYVDNIVFDTYVLVLFNVFCKNKNRVAFSWLNMYRYVCVCNFGLDSEN